MSLGGDFFYHKTTRKVLALFGYLFSNIHVKHDLGDGTFKTIKVPIAFASPHRDHPAYVEDPSFKPKEGVRVRTILPRMGYTLENWSYDAARKKNSAEKMAHATNGLATNQLQKVPYDLNITLGILVDTVDDLFQIIEQITPWFDPKLTVSANLNSELGLADDVHFFLNSVDPNINYEGSFEDQKTIEATLTFTVKSYMYRRTTAESVILKVDVDVLNTMDETIELSIYTNEHITEVPDG